MMEPFTDIIQYQFIQDGEKEYTLKSYVCEAPTSMKHKQLVILSIDGNDAVVNARIVDEIEKLESERGHMYQQLQSCSTLR